VKLSPTGSHVWSKQFGTPDPYGEVGEEVAFDAAGNFLLTGEIIESIDFGGGPLTAPTASYDVFVAKFSPAGVHLWSERFPSPWDDHGTHIAADPSGNVVLCGDFYDSIDFGGGPLLSPGGVDGYVAKLAP